MSRKNPNNKWVFTTKRERSHEILGTQGRNGDFFFFLKMEMEPQVNPTHNVNQSVRERERERET